MEKKTIILKGESNTLLIFLATLIEVSKDMGVEVAIIVDG